MAGRINRIYRISRMGDYISLGIQGWFYTILNILLIL